MAQAGSSGHCSALGSTCGSGRGRGRPRCSGGRWGDIALLPRWLLRVPCRSSWLAAEGLLPQISTYSDQHLREGKQTDVVLELVEDMQQKGLEPSLEASYRYRNIELFGGMHWRSGSLSET